MVKVISLIKNQEQESPFYELSLNAHAHREQSYVISSDVWGRGSEKGP